MIEWNNYNLFKINQYKKKIEWKISKQKFSLKNFFLTKRSWKFVFNELSNNSSICQILFVSSIVKYQYNYVIIFE